ncbi:MAG: DNA repair protein RadA [Bacteroidales bacterium]
MARAKTAFFCTQCGAESPKWLGRCPACGAWNSFAEEVIKRPTPGREHSPMGQKPVHIDEITSTDFDRLVTGNQEFDRVLGGGFVPGSLVLIGGEPGIGKSTLLLQIALSLKDARVLYVSGEESTQQIRMRADRLASPGSGCFILTETQLEEILAQAETTQPRLIIVDSIQTLQTSLLDASAGTVSQVRECTAQLQRFAKTRHIPVVLIGHITKDGMLAGPKILEHMVDAVLQFEGDRNHGYRILRASKNRFGSASELGIFEMQAGGLREVSNPSEILMTQHSREVSGVAIAAGIEGLRPMLIEVQALAGVPVYSTPQRSATGFDQRRLNMLLAVLEKRLGFRLSARDVFLNVAGGIRIEDPAADLAVVASVISSSEDIPINHQICFAGEVGLSGEIRPVPRIDARIAEAARLGFQQIFISRYALKSVDNLHLPIQITALERLDELIAGLFV